MMNAYGREEFIVPGLCDISAGTNAAGSLTKWYRNTIFPDALELEQNGGPDAYNHHDARLDKIPVGRRWPYYTPVILLDGKNSNK